jgi:hypothetical protein|tara:strand:- start:3256 stop:3672 length:417 start_codon:yes stop_codon:yes gene_type:complete
MPIGNMLRDRQEQYVAQKDSAGTWRILDTWHEDLTKLDPEDEINDASEAVTILSEGGFLALVREATRLGVLQNAALIENDALADQVAELKEENDRLKIQIETTPAATVTHEEKAGLKQHAINTIAKIVAIDSVEVTEE